MFLSESFCCFCMCDNSGYRFLYNGLPQIMNSLSCTYRYPPLGLSLGLCFFLSCLLIGCCYVGSSEISISSLSGSSQFFTVDFRWRREAGCSLSELHHKKSGQHNALHRHNWLYCR